MHDIQNPSDVVPLFLTLPVPILDEERKLTQILILTILCGPAKGFMKALKAFIKLFEAPQRSVKILIYLNFFTFSGIGTLMVKQLAMQTQMLKMLMPLNLVEL